MKLIDKSALVAEIERMKNYYENIQMIKPVYESNIEDFNELLSFIENLEVKEVDLDFEQELYKAFGQVKDFTLGMRIAKHFFELGLKTKGE